VHIDLRLLFQVGTLQNSATYCCGSFIPLQRW
jgi:hypothetical protein